MLRRTKSALEASLPRKTERAVPCPASAYQHAMLQLLHRRGADAAAAAASAGGAGAVQGINNVLMEMRKVCNDPLTSRLHVAGADLALRDQCTPPEVQLGGKLAVLTALLRRLVPAGAPRRAAWRSLRKWRSAGGCGSAKVGIGNGRHLSVACP